MLLILMCTNYDFESSRDTRDIYKGIFANLKSNQTLLLLIICDIGESLVMSSAVDVKKI